MGRTQATLTTGKDCDHGRVLEALHPQGQIANVCGNKLVIDLPYFEDLPKTLDDLEVKKAQLGVEDIAISRVSLERVLREWVSRYVMCECNVSNVKNYFTGLRKKKELKGVANMSVRKRRNWGDWNSWATECSLCWWKDVFTLVEIGPVYWQW